MYSIVTVLEDLILRSSENFEYAGLGVKKCPLYFIACNLLCIEFAIFSSLIVMLYGGLVRSCKNILKNAV